MTCPLSYYFKGVFYFKIAYQAEAIGVVFENLNRSVDQVERYNYTSSFMLFETNQAADTKLWLIIMTLGIPANPEYFSSGEIGLQLKDAESIINLALRRGLQEAITK